MRSRRSGGGGDRAASWATRELLAARRSATRRRAGGPGIADQGAVELLEEAAAALGDESSELRVGLLAGLARALDFQGDHERGGDRPQSAIAMARRLDDRAGLATVLMRSYWSRGTSSLEEILDDAHRGEGRSARSSATPRSAPRRWPGACRPSSRSATSTSARREVAALRETAEQTAQPFMLHVAEHYGSAIALCDGRLDGGRGRGAALARVEPAADRARRVGRLRDPDVQHPPRAGAAGRARAR